MKKFLIFLFCFAIAGSLQAGNFQNFLDRINSLPDSLRPAVVDSFMSSVPGFPYVEQDSLVHYIFRGNASSVTIPGDANNWDPAGFAMKRIEGTDLWFCTRVFEPDARLDYKFVLNGQYWILDPLNPRRIPGGMGTNSELRMPGCSQSSTTAYHPDIPHGTITDTLSHSKYLGNSRNIRIYLPPQYQSSPDSFGLVLFHDGPDYISLGSANNTLDYLIWKKRIRPVIGLFVPAVNRRGEYAGALQPQFEEFIVKELLPWFDSAYRTRKDASWRATIGASNGGNIALYLAVAHPRLFGKVGVQSSNAQPSILEALSNGPRLDLKFYADIGKYDIPVLIERVGHLKEILNQKKYPFEFREINEGHSWGNWSAHLGDILEYFFPLPGANTGIQSADR